MDLFEPARIPDNVPLEDMIKTLAELKNEGHFQHIGLSECSAATLRKAHAVHPITAVEIEVSLWSYEEETKKGTSIGPRADWIAPLTTTLVTVIATSKELGIVVAAYSYVL